MFKLNKLRKIKVSNNLSVQLINNVFASFLIKGLSLFVSFYSLPAYIRYFSNQTILGVWFTAISVFSWILTFDLGIGNGLRNHLVEPLIKKDNDEINKNISSAFFSVCSIVLASLIILIYVIYRIDWLSFFQVPVGLVQRETIIFMVIMIVIGILLQFVLKLLNSVLYALQKPAIIGLLNLSSSLLMLMFLTFSSHSVLDSNLKSVSVAYIFITSFPYFIIGLILFRTILKTNFPKLRYFSFVHANKIMKLGGIFFYLQILTMVMFGTNEILITRLINSDAVVQFQVYNRLFSLIGTVFNLAITPVWSAVTEAFVKNDIDWIEKLNKKLNLLLLFSIPANIVLVMLMPLIISIWLKGIFFESNLIFGLLFAVYNVLFMKMSVDTSIIAGLGNLKIQAINLTITTILKFVLSLWLILINDSWIMIIVANIVSLMPYVIVEYFDIRYRLKLARENNFNDHK